MLHVKKYENRPVFCGVIPKKWHVFSLRHGVDLDIEKLLLRPEMSTMMTMTMNTALDPDGDADHHQSLISSMGDCL